MTIFSFALENTPSTTFLLGRCRLTSPRWSMSIPRKNCSADIISVSPFTVYTPFVSFGFWICTSEAGMLRSASYLTAI